MTAILACPSTRFVREALAGAVHRIARGVPLEHAGAAQPFPGFPNFAQESFEEASRRLARACGARMLMPDSGYRDAYAEGRFDGADIEAAVRRRAAQGHISVDDLLRHIAAANDPGVSALQTCACVVSTISGTDWGATITERVVHWASGYFGAGRAGRPSPFCELPPFQTWLRESRVDRGDLVPGLRYAKELLDGLPEDPETLCLHAIERLALPAGVLDLYLYRLLLDVNGWVAHARSWRRESAAASPVPVLDLLAIRLAWELILHREFACDGAEFAWRRSITAEGRKAGLDAPLSREELLDFIAQESLEHGSQRRLISALDRPGGGRGRGGREVWPEWGSAGGAGFIAAPRQMTRRLEREGLCSLHAYDHCDDRDFSRLEQIMTAPMIAASRPGHGRQRLSAFLAAPITAINSIIEKHEDLRHLVDKGWLHLFAIYDGGDIVVRYAGEFHWEPASGQYAA